jgi:hypothetical protein
MRPVIFDFAILFAVVATNLNAAPPADDALTLKVRVALALSQSHVGACGECVFDEPEARSEAMAANKPLVLLVGGCDGRGKVAVASGATACVVKEYDHKTTARMVLLTPKADKSGWLISGELPATATDAELRKAVADATPAVPAKMPSLNWDIQADDKPAVVPTVEAKVKRYRQVCVGGVCRLEEIVE